MTRDDVIRSTAQHIQRVGQLLGDEAADLNRRAVNHDASKWSADEWPAFEESTPKLAALTYGSDEYKQALSDIKPALDHHYKVNRHHPEYHASGIAEMDLLDLIEMLCDWKAATERHNDGSIYKSLIGNRTRFKISGDIFGLLVHSCFLRSWITWEERVALLKLAESEMKREVDLEEAIGVYEARTGMRLGAEVRTPCAIKAITEIISLCGCTLADPQEPKP